MSSRRVLIISPHFPPATAPDMQRVRMSLAAYRAHGWEPTVLCVGAHWQSCALEPELERTIPPNVEIVRCTALPVRWTRLVGVRNTGLRCWAHFLLTGSRLLRGRRFDLVFFSTTQWVVLTLGRIWRFFHGVPYAFDMHDPWRTDSYSTPGASRPPGGWKYQFARVSAWALEGWSFRRVSAVMSVSPDYVSDLRARYPHLRACPTAVIPFGAARSDLAHARGLPVSVEFTSLPADTVNIIYTGAIVGGMPPLLRFLFSTLREYCREQPSAARLRFHFFGTHYGSPGSRPGLALQLAREFGVEKQVREVPHRLGHLECLRLQSAADALLLPGSSDLAYSPSKIYPYVLSRRPILALVVAGSVLESVLDTLGCALCVRLLQPDGDNAARATLRANLELALAGFPEGALPARDEQRLEHMVAAEYHAGAQCALFNAALAGA